MNSYIFFVTGILCGLAAGAGLLLFYQRKVTRFFGAMDDCMNQMMDRSPSITFPRQNPPESVMARFENKLQRVYQLIQESEAKIQSENEILQTLVSDISHQVKTPLTNINMSLSILSESIPAGQPVYEFIDNAVHQTGKLDFLLQTLIKLSRLETGVLTLKPALHRIFETLAGAVGSVMPAAEKKMIEFQVDCPPDIEAIYDPKWTEELFSNLLDNAIKYSPAGSVITISVQKWECYVKVTFTDQGIGIPEAIQGSIFNRFFRADEVQADEGLGIGLYLCREIVQRENGFITVESEPEKGASFSVFLPC